MKKLYFWVFDFICGHFWILGDVVMGLLLEWRKAPPWTQSSFLYPSSSQSSFSSSIEVRKA